MKLSSCILLNNQTYQLGLLLLLLEVAPFVGEVRSTPRARIMILVYFAQNSLKIVFYASLDVLMTIHAISQKIKTGLVD